MIDAVLLAALTVAATGHVSARGQGLMDSLPAPTGTAPTGEGSFGWHSYEGPEGSRRYKLYVPDKTGKRRRLLVMLHGCTQDPEDLALGTQMNEVTAAKGFLVLYPEQPASANPLKCWNWFTSANQRRGEGEPALLAAIIRRVVREQKVDPAKVYAAGVSAGGAMTAILGATYPEMFSGLGVHSGIAYGLATRMSEALVAMRTPSAAAGKLGEAVINAMGERRRVVPVFIAQGSIDASVNVANAKLLADQWLAANGHAGARPEVLRMAATGRLGGNRSIYRDAKGRTLVDVWIVDGLAHAWSGGSKDGTYTDERGPDMSRAMMDFFIASEKRRR